MPVCGAAVAAIEVDIGQGCGRAVLCTIRRPLIGVDRLCRAFACVVDACHEREDIFEVLDGSDAWQTRRRRSHLHRAKLTAGRVVVAAAAGIDIVDRLGEIKLLQKMPAEAADVGGLER